MATDLSDRGEAEVEDLIHHGVKGQKWGVIRKKASAGRAATARALKKTGRFTVDASRKTASGVRKAKQAHDQRVAGKKQAKADAKARKKFANRGYKKISDTELQSRIKRLEQEKRYRELKADRHLVRGREVTRSILENSLTKAGTYAATKAMKTAFDKSFDPGKTGKSAGETLKKAAEKAKEAAEAASVVAEEAKAEYRSTGGPTKVKSPTLPKSKTPKQIEKPKSYKQTKPSPKKKRYPRNPGSTAK
jgi:hypothetical protein|nr:MAG TPA: hypothetical protein [Caudoviricetes sp.]